MAHSGKRLLAATVDNITEIDTSRRFAVIPQGPDVSDGFRDLSMKELFQAVVFMCWWIEGTIGPAHSRETLAYLGSNDMRYCIFMLACQKTSYQAFLPSTRNSDEAHLHLLKATNCTKFFYSQYQQTRALGVQKLSPTVNSFQVPAMETILGNESGHRSYPYTKTYAEEENETVCIIHSSGTTGMPNPVFLTNGFFAAMDVIAKIPCPVDRQPAPFFHLGPEILVLVTTPFFHLIGLIGLLFSTFHGTPALIGPAKPLSVEYFIELMQTALPTAAVYPPSILEDLSYSDEALACLKGLQTVYIGGAPLAPETGDRLQQYTHVVAVIGTSEIGWIPSIIPEDPAEWSYFEWNEAFGVDMQDAGDGLVSSTLTPISTHTQPTTSTLDVVVLSNGEKLNPVGMETIIEGHPLVGRAVVVGQSRFQAGLLLEPNNGVPEVDSKLLVEEIWPIVQVANQTIAAHGRVMKNKIRLGSKNKPFTRTPKGTTMRRVVIQDYEEIDALYAAGLEDDLDTNPPETLDQESIMHAGLDSLMTIQVSRMLQKGIQLRRPEVKPGVITPQIIYGNPTVEQLSQDTLSAIMVEIVHTRHATQFESPWAVFHLTNPERTPWVALIPAIQETYAVEPVEFGAWVADLESIPNPSSADIAEKPALKLLSFYRGFQEEGSVMSVELDARRAKEASATMRSPGPVSVSLMRNWLQQWQF